MKTKLFIVIAVILTSLVIAQKGDYTKYEGYIDLGSFEALQNGEEVTEVLIEEHLIRMVAKMAKSSEPELSEVLKGIKLVKVHAFASNEESFDNLKERAEKIDKELMEKNWDRIVKMKSSREFANVYIKTTTDDKISGLVVATGELNGEAAFVNIVGDINLETIGKLGDKFGIPSLDQIGKENGGN